MGRARWNARPVLLVALFVLGAVRPVVAQPATDESHAIHSSSSAAFLAAARAGTERYRDRAVAIADGFRKVGPSFPAMGEHWVRPAVLLRESYEARRPAVLTYITVDGKPVLAGVGYVLRLAPGEKPPAVPAGRHVWHDHSGTLAQESFTHPPPPVEAHSVLVGPAIAVMHAWLWIDNPAGMFTVDNWALPLARLRLAAPDSFSETAAKAVSLVDDSGRYYDQLLVTLAADDTASATAMLERLKEARVMIESEIGTAALDKNGVLTADRLQRLEKTWVSLWCDLGKIAPINARGRIDRIQSCHPHGVGAGSRESGIGSRESVPQTPLKPRRRPVSFALQST